MRRPCSPHRATCTWSMHHVRGDSEPSGARSTRWRSFAICTRPASPGCRATTARSHRACAASTTLRPGCSSARANRWWPTTGRRWRSSVHAHVRRTAALSPTGSRGSSQPQGWSSCPGSREASMRPRIAARSRRAATIAVLGCGIDRDYPRAHATLAAQIAERGFIVSEYPPESSPLRGAFRLERNRRRPRRRDQSSSRRASAAAP